MLRAGSDGHIPLAFVDLTETPAKEKSKMNDYVTIYCFQKIWVSFYEKKENENNQLLS